MNDLKLIEMEAKLKACRSAMRNLFGNEYKTKIISYIEVINAASKMFNLNILQTTIRLCRCDDPHMRIALMAACVEILEPSDPPNTSISGQPTIESIDDKNQPLGVEGLTP